MKITNYSEINQLGEYSTFSGSYFPFTITFSQTIPYGSYFYFKLFPFNRPDMNIFTISKSITSDLVTGEYTFNIDNDINESIYTTKGLSGKYNFQIYIKSSNTNNSKITISPGNPAVFTATDGHSLENNQIIRILSNGTLPSPFLENTNYYVRDANIGGKTFKLSSSFNGTSISTSNSVQSGTHYIDSVYWYPPSQGSLVVLPTITYNRKYWV